MPEREIARLRTDALAIFAAALRAVDPAPLVSAALSLRGRSVFVDLGHRRVRVPADSIFLAGAGKAVQGMAAGAARVLPGTPGIFLRPTPDAAAGGPAATVSAFAEAGRRQRSRQGAGAFPGEGACEFREEGAHEFLNAEHPVPGRGSFAGTQRLLARLAALRPDATVLFLLSGGASALLEAPATGLSARQVQVFTRKMLRAGAPIDLLNAARVRLSAVKGGGLARAVAPRRVLTLAISDVPTARDAPQVIGSGPTLPPLAGEADRDLLGEIEALPGFGRIRGVLRTHLGPHLRSTARERGAASDFAILADNRRARRAAAAAARMRGYRTRTLRAPLSGEARVAAARFVAALAALPSHVSCCIQGGETTVSVADARGCGGRNQEFALAVAQQLSGSGWVLLAAGTDGVDGPTEAAGGLIDGRTAGRIGKRALARALADHDSFTALGRAPAGTRVQTGPTGSNVGDLVVAVRL